MNNHGDAGPANLAVRPLTSAGAGRQFLGPRPGGYVAKLVPGDATQSKGQVNLQVA